MLEAQADAIDIPIVKQVTPPNMYEQTFKNTMLQLKAKGAEGLVTGDIYEVSRHERSWLERVCREVGLEPIRPLWQTNTLQLFKDFLAEGFKAAVVRTKGDVLSEDWLGRELDEQFLQDLLNLGNIDPCGENGEYHTFVTDGPNFRKRIRLMGTRKSTVNGYGHLEILQMGVEPKKLKSQLSTSNMPN